MTMLDRMRRHKNWLKWSLVLVVVAFILLYIPEFVAGPSGIGPNAVVATVEGREIKVATFRRTYQQQMDAYRSAYGGNMDIALLRQLGIDRRIVQQMIDEEAALAEAARLEITASDAEVRARILAMGAFQENGHFSQARYTQVLQMQNPPMRPPEFEEQVRRSITVEKLQGALTDWITLSDAEVAAEYRNRNEKVKLAVVAFPADKFREGVTATDDELATHFEANKNQYRIPEKRKVKYALLDTQAIRQRTVVTPEDVKRHYEDNIKQYSSPEQVRASHILLKTEGKDEAAVKKEAEAILAKAKAGADFAKLANQHTEEEIGKGKGGDLDFFGRGQMVPEFEKVAFALKPGEISDVVKTQFGFHVIKVTDRREATTKTLEDVRSQLEDQVRWERAQAEAQRIADDVTAQMKKPEDFDTVAKARGFVVGESAFFAKGEPISGIGLAPAVTERAFSLQDGQISEALRTQAQGTVFITVTGRQDSYLPKLDEVKARVREDVLKRKAIDAAREKASSISAQLKSGNFDAVAKRAGLEAKTTEFITRGAAIPEIGSSPAVDAAAFALAAGEVSDPIVTDNGAVIVKALERTEVTAEEITKGKGTLRDEMLNERRNRFFSAYMAKAREKMKIDINPQVLAQVVV